MRENERRSEGEKLEGERGEGGTGVWIHLHLTSLCHGLPLHSDHKGKPIQRSRASENTQCVAWTRGGNFHGCVCCLCVNLVTLSARAVWRDAHRFCTSLLFCLIA